MMGGRVNRTVADAVLVEVFLVRLFKNKPV